MIGKTISHYKILEKLGSGGMGEVYKAEDLKLRRTVALKLLPPELTNDEKSKERLRKEAIAASALDHPNIGTIYEIAESDEHSIIVMSYYEGGTLKDKITSLGTGLPIKDALDIAIQIARGLSKAHKKGIVHRDIKPANILFTEEGQVKIIDFGLSKLKGSSLVTKPGTTMGTIAYMSPEQAQSLEVDHRTDIWTLAVILHEMMTGKQPFKGDHEQAVMYLIINEEPEFINKIRSDVPHQIVCIIERALAKKPEKRFSTMQEMLDELELAAEEIREGHSKKPPVFRLRKTQRKTVLQIVIIFLVMIVFGFYLWQNKYGKTKPVSVALLPLKSQTNDIEQEWFSDNMTGALTFKLAQVSGLRVTSLSSTIHYKGTTKSAPLIAEELGVRYLIESSAEKMEEDVVISAGIIDALKDEIIWAEEFEEEFSNIKRLQGDVAKAIANRLQANLTPSEKKRFAEVQPTNPETHTLITRGLFLVNKLTPDGIQKGLEYLHQAVEKDPEEPRAHAGLALGYSILAHTATPPPGAMERSKEAAKKALKLDETLADAHLALGMAKIYDEWDKEGAKRAFLRALELEPSLALAHNHYGWFLFLMGQRDKALAELQLAKELDPLSPVYPTDQGWAYYFKGDYDKTIEVTEKSLEMYPDNPYAWCIRGFGFSGKKMTNEAVTAMQKAIELSPYWKWALAFTYAKAGRTDEALLLAAELENQPAIYDAWCLAVVFASLGNDEKMFFCLEQAYQQRHPFIQWIKRNGEYFEDWYDDPRLIDLAQRMDLPE